MQKPPYDHAVKAVGVGYRQPSIAPLLFRATASCGISRTYSIGPACTTRSRRCGLMCYFKLAYIPSNQCTSVLLSTVRGTVLGKLLQWKIAAFRLSSRWKIDTRGQIQGKISDWSVDRPISPHPGGAVSPAHERCPISAIIEPTRLLPQSLTEAFSCFPLLCTLLDQGWSHCLRRRYPGRFNTAPPQPTSY